MKLIDGYLDSYYSSKLIKALGDFLTMEFNADFLIESNGDGWVIIMSKMRKLADKFYTSIYSFREADAVVILSNLSEAKRHLERKYKELIKFQRETIL